MQEKIEVFLCAVLFVFPIKEIFSVGTSQLFGVLICQTRQSVLKCRKMMSEMILTKTSEIKKK